MFHLAFAKVKIDNCNYSEIEADYVCSTMMRRLRLLLFPFSILYHGITALRNWAYNKGWLRSFEFTVPVIGVGNLKVGGTGKTPMVEYLARHYLQNKEQVGILSRGYKRKTKGFVLAGDQSTTLELGDEPMQYHSKFGGKVAVAVGEDRAFCIPMLLTERPQISRLILDDIFQHRTVKPHANILLTEFYDLFTHDLLLPAGNLRESRVGAQRADIIVVTKCPVDLKESDFHNVTKEIQQYCQAKTPIFFTTVVYGQPEWLPYGQPIGENRFFGFSGIAQPKPFKDYLNNAFDLAGFQSFGDHHQYAEKEIVRLIEQAKQTGADLITTEKDATRLTGFSEVLKNTGVYYLPMEIRFLKDEDQFWELLEELISQLE